MGEPVVELVAKPCGHGEVGVIGPHLKARVGLLEVALKRPELDRGPVEKGPGQGKEGELHRSPG